MAFFPSRLEEVTAICERVAHDIRNQNTIAYEPSIKAKRRVSLSIRVVAAAQHRGRLVVRTRTAYIAGGVPSAE